MTLEDTIFYYGGLNMHLNVEALLCFAAMLLAFTTTSLVLFVKERGSDPERDKRQRKKVSTATALLFAILIILVLWDGYAKPTLVRSETERYEYQLVAVAARDRNFYLTSDNGTIYYYFINSEGEVQDGSASEYFAKISEGDGRVVLVRETTTTRRVWGILFGPDRSTLEFRYEFFIPEDGLLVANN